jgi:hypothetical protein
MRSWRWYPKVLSALLVAALAYWVWPTPWGPYPCAVYSRGGRDYAGTWGQTTVRVNRLHGHAEELRPWGWEQARPER